ncbi:hypothetical protein M514_01159 [Trichuris suis]|uniref:GATA zinc finger n=1 Tax=Trichuris suis TaxID=68888 RepID=A0A085ML30_9BILA|nr:hypothetical protein M513_01159 [Trichuris suis]KFD70895.1 hypothetical protein M514_01159 [Trichuris suis]KHJ45791.1 hypothetical protein D918_04003 [Trichuris suis]
MASQGKSCCECRGNLSTVWHRLNKKGKLQCHLCFEITKHQKKVEQDLAAEYSSWNGRRELRKRLYYKYLLKGRTKSRPFPGYKFNCNYLSLATGLRLVPSIRHEGRVYQRGDIISMIDGSDRFKYYARIVEIAVSAHDLGYFGISWLVPKIGGASLAPFCEDNFESSYVHPTFVPVDVFEFVKAAN